MVNAWVYRRFKEGQEGVRGRGSGNDRVLLGGELSLTVVPQTRSRSSFLEGENDRPRENLLHKYHLHGGQVRSLQDGGVEDDGQWPDDGSCYEEFSKQWQHSQHGRD
jgi:hypothetical protein